MQKDIDAGCCGWVIERGGARNKVPLTPETIIGDEIIIMLSKLNKEQSANTLDAILNKNTKLGQLLIHDCCIEYQEAKKVAEIIWKSTELTTFAYGDCSVSSEERIHDEGAQLIWDALYKHENVNDIYFGAKDISPEMRTKFDNLARTRCLLAAIKDAWDELLEKRPEFSVYNECLKDLTDAIRKNVDVSGMKERIYQVIERLPVESTDQRVSLLWMQIRHHLRDIAMEKIDY